MVNGDSDDGCDNEDDTAKDNMAAEEDGYILRSVL